MKEMSDMHEEEVAVVEEQDEEFPLLSISSPSILSLCSSFTEDQDDDLPSIFITSYPKSGTTWMQCIVYNLLTKGDQSFDHISNYTPFYEASSTWNEEKHCLSSHFFLNHTKIGRRVFNTHLYYPMMPKGKKMKYIYIIRHGKDVALSFYHHLSNQDDKDHYSGSLTDFLQDWVNGKIIFGRWLKHVECWMKAYQQEVENGRSNTILIVRYEDLIHHLEEQMQRIAQFLDLSLSDQDIHNIAPFVTFDYMKSHSEQFSPVSVPWKTGFEFIRSGRVGGSKDVFSEADDRIYAEMIAKAYPHGLPSYLAELNII